jgi:hypothetical protein
MSEASAQFLKGLRRGLKWRVPPEEANDIIRDYQEFFDEEQKSGKTEAQISEALGPPQNVIRAILEERPQLFLHRLYWPCVVLAVVAALFLPILDAWPYFQSLLWPFVYLPGFHFAFVFLAPVPALLLYCMQPPNGRQISDKRYTWALIGMAGLSLLLFCGILSGMHRFFKELHTVDEKLVFLLQHYYPQVAVIIFTGVLWLLCIFLSTKAGRYSPALYFLYAAIHASLNFFSNMLAVMDLSDSNLMPLDHLAYEAFFSVAMFFLCSAIGAGLWCGLQTFLGKRGGV